MTRPELEFLPAVSALEETPPPPAARVAVWVLLALIVAAALWSVLGEVDVVSSAPGTVIPSGRSKLVQAPETTVVRAILVADGQHVDPGAPLVELDPSGPAADLAHLREEQLTLELARCRLSALLAAGTAHAERISRDRCILPALKPDPARVAREYEHRAREFAEYRGALNALDVEHRAQRAERAAIDARIEQLAATLPLVTERVHAHEILLASGLVPRVQWLELERDRIAVAQELAVQRAQRLAIDEHLTALRERRKVTDAQFQARWMTELTASDTRLSACREALAKAERRLALMRVTAPVAGTVQQLAVHTEGGVVTVAQPLMRIVPDDTPLEVEARVANKDIGFVRRGQDAVIKIETFNFTRYGYLQGRVADVSHDAVADAEHGQYYLARVVLTRRHLRVDGRDAPLTPGMAVVVEVAHGRRRIIEFLLSPLLRHWQESGRER